MTPADWQALAARFEAADETAIYECVRELCRTRWLDPDGALDIRLWSEDELTCIDSQSEIISLALMAKSPGLLLGVVVACVPEKFEGSLDWWHVGGSGQTNAAVIVRAPMGRPIENSHVATGMVQALGAAVCRAWAEVAAGGKEVV